MSTVEEQIRIADEVICGNIDSLTDQRALLLQNVLAQRCLAPSGNGRPLG